MLTDWGVQRNQSKNQSNLEAGQSGPDRRRTIMANITRSNGGAGGLRDPLAFARDLFSWDPFFRLDWPVRQFAAQGASAYVPAFNVVEKPDGYYITADLPGVREEDLDVTVQD